MWNKEYGDSRIWRVSLLALLFALSVSGANVSAGTFSGGTGIIGFESGIILSTGDIASVSGPNTADDTTTNNSMPGDANLDSLIPGYTTLTPSPKHLQSHL